MKIFVKITALLLCLLFVAGTAGCAKETDPAKTIVAKVNGENIFRSEFDSEYKATLNMYSQYGMPVDETDEDQVTKIKNSILDGIVLNKVLIQKAKEQGFDKLSQEKTDEIAKTVDEAFSSLEADIKAEVEEEAKNDTSIVVDKEVKKRMEEYLKKISITREGYLKSLMENEYVDALQEDVNSKVTVSDEEIQKWYDDNLKTQTEEVKASAAKYETYDNQGLALYVPEGIVKIHQILIKVPEDKSETAKGLYNDGKKEEAFDVLKTSFEGIQAKADEVLAKVKAEEDFMKLIEQYGEDDGMKNEPGKTEGYRVVPGTSTYLQEFTDAALKLTKLGDTSGLVKTVYGYHILKNTGSVAPGAVALDKVKDNIKEEVLSDKQSSDWKAKQEAWKKEAKIEYFRNRLFD